MIPLPVQHIPLGIIMIAPSVEENRPRISAGEPILDVILGISPHRDQLFRCIVTDDYAPS